MCSLSEPRIRRIKRKTPIKKPSRYPTVEHVGVGLPNPSGEEDDCLSLQRSVMSIAGR